MKIVGRFLRSMQVVPALAIMCGAFIILAVLGNLLGGVVNWGCMGGAAIVVVCIFAYVRSI